MKKNFRISAALKNIIGRDLITDDFIAIYELVKNSYDANAKEVTLTFNENEIIIKDDGKGMSKEDIENKWLFVAYSAKTDGSEDKEDRNYAGAKGIGRFSCDKLGDKLKLFSKKAHSESSQILEVNWKDFELDSKKDFIDVDVDLREGESNIIDHSGTVLHVTEINNIWDETKLDLLKKALQKLVNPFESISNTQDFRIILKAPLFQIDEVIESQVFTKLGLQTTQIIADFDSRYITTELIDRGVTLYKIREKNVFSKVVKCRVHLYNLNRSAKIHFRKLRKEAPVHFGSVFLFKNGFMVPPFGNPDDDTLGLDKRKGQGFARYLGTRDLIGSVQIQCKGDSGFKEASSRNSGLEKTAAYSQLIEAFYKVVKIFEKYVVDVTWVLEKGIKEEDEGLQNLTYIDNEDGKSKIIDMISTLVKGEVKLLEFNTKFLDILSSKLEGRKVDILNKLHGLADKQGDKDFANRIDSVKVEVEKLNQEKLKAERNLSKADEARGEAEQRAIKAEQKAESAEEEVVQVKVEKEIISKALEIETKKGAFQGALIGTDKERIVGLQHQIYHSSSRVNRNIELLMKHLGVNNIDEKTQKYLKAISLEASKINSIANFITKANFNLKASEIETDIIDFIKEYIGEIYLYNDRVIDVDMEIVIDSTEGIEHIIKFRPLEITTVVDNLLSNSEKAGAKLVEIKFEKDQEGVIIQFCDNGKGISEENLSKVYEMGFTTTRGSGIGLFQARDLITNGLGGDLMIESKEKHYTKVSLVLP